MSMNIPSSTINVGQKIELEMGDTGGAFVSLHFVIPNQKTYKFQDTYSGKLMIPIKLPVGEHDCVLHVFAYPDGVSPTVNTTLKINGVLAAQLTTKTPPNGSALYKFGNIKLIVT